MDAIGKTIARIEEDEDYGGTIYFTDGSALRITSDDSLLWEDHGPGEWQRKLQVLREKQRLARLRREKFAALPQEEQDRRERQRRSRMGAFQRAYEDEMEATLVAWRNDMNRAFDRIPK